MRSHDRSAQASRLRAILKGDPPPDDRPRPLRVAACKNGDTVRLGRRWSEAEDRRLVAEIERLGGMRRLNLYECRRIGALLGRGEASVWHRARHVWREAVSEGGTIVSSPARAGR